MNLTSASQVKQLLARHGLRPKKRLGQNFLIDHNILNRIVAESGAAKDKNILEIGAGLGVVTQALAAAGARVVCVEADKTLAPVLDESISVFNNVELIIGDFLKLDLHGLLSERTEGKWIVVGNLPYYITTPIIIRLIENRKLLANVLVMVQREVAERLGAAPGTAEYGSITVLVNYHFNLERVTGVSRNVFYPVPEVDSELIRLTPRTEPPVHVSDENLLFRVVRAAFEKRRKTLLNALSSSAGLGWGREEAARVLNIAGIDQGRRGETLSLIEFASIADSTGSIKEISDRNVSL